MSPKNVCVGGYITLSLFVGFSVWFAGSLETIFALGWSNKMGSEDFFRNIPNHVSGSQHQLTLFL